jgi:hypothetical protein
LKPVETTFQEFVPKNEASQQDFSTKVPIKTSSSNHPLLLARQVNLLAHR